MPRLTGGLIDYDASNEGLGGQATGPLTYPNPTNNAHRGFPLFPAGYSNATAPELSLHPLLSSLYVPQGDDRRLPVTNVFNLLNTGGGANWQASDLGQLAPGNFGNARTRALVTTDSNHMDRPALTPWVFDLQTSNENAPYQNTYAVQPTGTYGPHGAPQGSQVQFPPPSWRTTPPPNWQAAFSEFGAADWRAVNAALGKVDLNRFLSPYPHMGSGTSWSTYSSVPLTSAATGNRFDASPAILAQFLAAQTDRQNLANDIYRRLLAVTSVPPVATPAAPGPTDLAPRRWLAQLAANIVDFIDEDGISTPFNFYNTTDGLPATSIGATNPSGPDQMPLYWVFGTELPRVVLNEAMIEYQVPTPPAMGQPATKFNVRTFVELFSPVPGGPLPPGVQPLDSQPVPLYMPAAGSGTFAYSTHQIVIAPTNPAGLGGGDQGLYYNAANINDNVLGTPYTDTQTPNPRGTTDFSGGATVSTVGPNPGTLPASISPQQFFLVGPATLGGQDAHNDIVAVSKGGSVPDATPWLKSAGMEYQAGTQPNSGGPTWTTDDRANGLTILLRRLANPHLPPSSQLFVNGALNPAYNPYVTTDYLRGVPLNNATTVYTSVGKVQPYAAATSQVVAQTQAVPNSPVKYTFGLQNVPVNQFDWLVHLDRQLISPMELLHVSAYHPHELTHRFIPRVQPAPGLPVNQPVAGHRAPWYDQTTRLYRAFELLGTHDRTWGVGFGGRVPGMININTIWDPETFRALCDPQPGNGFTGVAPLPATQQVDAIYQAMITSRTPNGAPGPNDQPFLGMGIGNMPAGSPSAPAGTGINSTFLRANAGNTGRLFDVTSPNNQPLHPYQQTELMTKIFSHVTTRSNVFAVWCTVGFFQVTNDAAQPPTLGPEVNSPTYPNPSPQGVLRRQFFCIVDRTNMTLDPNNPRLQGPQPWFLSGNTTVTPGAQTVTVPALNGTYDGAPFNIQVGTPLLVDVGANQEVVMVTAVTSPPALPAFSATFTKPHAYGFPISNAVMVNGQPPTPVGVLMGNPGPQPNFNFRSSRYTPVVRFFAYLQ